MKITDIILAITFIFLIINGFIHLRAISIEFYNYEQEKKSSQESTKE